MLARLLCAVLLVTASGRAWAQTIQLPSFSNVGVNTTVIVPDSGGAYLAGDRRASSSWTSFGAFPRAGLGRAPASRRHRRDSANPRSPGRRCGVARCCQTQSGQRCAAAHGRRASRCGAAPPGSVADLEKRRQQQAADAQGKAMALWDKARAAQTAGKASVAKIYYGMAARQATGDLRDSIVAEYDRLAGQKAASEPQ